MTLNTKRCSECWAVVVRSRIERKLPAVYAGPPWSPPVVHVRTKNRLTSGRCRVCYEWFVSPHTDVTCSVSCRESYYREMAYEHRGRRRARKRKAFRAPVFRRKVYEADGYRCHLCGLLTDKTKQVPHPKAPTIDHVIPLADGGTHEPSNCRTAHFICNARKSDKGGGEQMLLLAV